MPNNSRALRPITIDLAGGLSAGGALRNEIFNRITPLLLESNGIGNSSTRLMVQACCLDVVTTVEEVIERYKLDQFYAVKEG
ncbi:MAG: hypothetical protein KDD42_09160 [Bdellovibrionales bacterium]|nr:hypothetical protein [Bdellovibrionales bacterium]